MNNFLYFDSGLGAMVLRQLLLDSKRDARHLFDDYTVSAFAKAFQKNLN
ncbi:MAG: hypothetical protein ACJAXY_000904 [Nonlabens sp.]|jgi:hypothetical protein